MYPAPEQYPGHQYSGHYSEQEKKALEQQIKLNQHEIFIVSFEEMDAILQSQPQWQRINDDWQKIRKGAEFGANYYSTADGARMLGKLVGDLGAFGAQTYIKIYGGKPHIILKGSPGLRRILTGTRYGLQNAKVVAMGLGTAGAVHATKAGGILSVVLVSAYRVIDYFLTDGATLNQLIGSLAVDVVKVGITVGASIGGMAMLISAFPALATLAIGPLAAVVVVGVLSSWALSAIDKHYGITDKVIKALDEIGDDVESYYDNVTESLKKEANAALDSVIDYAIHSVQRTIIDMARHRIDKFLPSRPGIF
jgi:hypothetical protein